MHRPGGPRFSPNTAALSDGTQLEARPLPPSSVPVPKAVADACTSLSPKGNPLRVSRLDTENGTRWPTRRPVAFGTYACRTTGGVPRGILPLHLVNARRYAVGNGLSAAYSVDPRTRAITFWSGPFADLHGRALEPGKIGLSSAKDGSLSAVCERR